MDDEDSFLYGDAMPIPPPAQQKATTPPIEDILPDFDDVKPSNGVSPILETKASVTPQPGPELTEKSVTPTAETLNGSFAMKRERSTSLASQEVDGDNGDAEEGEGEDDEEEAEESEDDIEFIMEPVSRSLDFRSSRGGRPTHYSTRDHVPTQPSHQREASTNLLTEYTPRERADLTKRPIPSPDVKPIDGHPALIPTIQEVASTTQAIQDPNLPDTSSLPAPHAPPSHPNIDPSVPGTFDSRSIFELDIAAMHPKPWRLPGADLSDYFNYGFDEISWEAYCYRRRETMDVGSAMKSNVLAFAGMSEDALAGVPVELRAMVMAGANAMMAGGMGPGMGPGMGSGMGPGMQGGMPAGMGGPMGMNTQGGVPPGMLPPGVGMGMNPMMAAEMGMPIGMPGMGMPMNGEMGMGMPGPGGPGGPMMQGQDGPSAGGGPPSGGGGGVSGGVGLGAPSSGATGGTGNGGATADGGNIVVQDGFSGNAEFGGQDFSDTNQGVASRSASAGPNAQSIPGAVQSGTQFRGRGGPGVPSVGAQTSMGVSGGVGLGVGATNLRGRGGFVAGRGRGVPMGMGLGRGMFVGPDGVPQQLPHRPASPLPPNVPTGPRNPGNRYKDRDNNAPEVGGLDYGGGRESRGDTPGEEDRERSRKRRSSPSLDDDRDRSSRSSKRR